jgi:beta-aspartyl-peptidase (threonine type)
MSAAGPAIAVHAGAADDETDRELLLDACRDALDAGVAILAAGGSALDAVGAAVRVLEDAPTCNAGTGGTLTSAGTLELDACIMDGATRRSGAVAVLPPFRHPIDVARAVMERTDCHLLAGEGAAAFAERAGFERADPASMITAQRRQQLAALGSRAQAGETVGAVALDAARRLAAATSTGGHTGLLPGRVGDVPIVGAGTYADAHAACSCTGDGEAFARASAALHASTETAAPTSGGPQAAAEQAVGRVLEAFGGRGGLILLDGAGEVGVACTMLALPHGFARPGGAPVVAWTPGGPPEVARPG